jgi:hypothetical protein
MLLSRAPSARWGFQSRESDATALIVGERCNPVMSAVADLCKEL